MAENAPSGSASAAEPETAPQGLLHKPALFLALCAGVALVAGGAGFAVAWMTAGGGTPLAPAEAEAGQPDAESPTSPAEGAASPAGSAATPAEAPEPLAYKDLESITVNLDEPRLARYVHATITLGIAKEEFEKVSQHIDANMLILRDWLTVYLTSLTLDEVRGPANLNRIRREILDAFNEKLWPNAKPHIRKVLFKDFAVK